jgi:hypothetical protein
LWECCGVRVIAYAICHLVFVPALMPTEVSAQPCNAGFSRLQTESRHYPTWQDLNLAATTPGLVPAPGNKQQLDAASGDKGIEKQKS